MGIIYDGHEEEITVTVNDNGDGTLEVIVVVDSDGATFNNIYEPRGFVEISANKVLTGAKLEDGQFKFQLFDDEGTILGTATNDAEGKIVFPALTYGLEDDGKTFTYMFKEIIPDTPEPGYLYDEHEVTVTVTVKDNGVGMMECEVNYSGDKTFKNDFDESRIPKTPGDDDKPKKNTDKPKTTTVKKTTSNKTPKTGDENDVAFWIGLFSLAGLVMALTERKRLSNNR